MLTLFFYFGIWLFVAWVIETAFGKILWTVFWFTPFVRQLFFGNKNPAEAPRQEAKPPIAENRPEAATGSFNATQQAPKRFSKAVPKSAVKFPVPNRAGRIVLASFQKGIPEAALVMAPRRIRPWKAVPADERSRASREYFAYRLKLPWILAASPALLARFLFGHPTWSIYNNDRIYKSKSFAKAGEEGSVFHALMTNEYMFADLCRQFDLVCNTLGDRNLASSYILDKNLSLTSLKRCTPDALVIDAGTWANPALKSVPLSDWCAGAAAAGLAAELGLALFSAKSRSELGYNSPSSRSGQLH